MYIYKTQKLYHIGIYNFNMIKPLLSLSLKLRGTEENVTLIQNAAR